MLVQYCNNEIEQKPIGHFKYYLTFSKYSD